MALVENQWTTKDELAKLDEEGKKKKLISSLALKLSPEKHTALGLALREVVLLPLLFPTCCTIVLLRSPVQQTAFAGWLPSTRQWTTP